MNNQEQNTTGKAAPKIELLPPSMSMRVGNRRLTMSWRPRKQLPHLLHGLLRRSWRAMFGSSLRMSATTIAICAAWNVPAMAAAPDVNTLPTGGTVTYGNATFSQTGNTLNINQTTGQAIANFTTFSIGANAVVNVNQPSAAAAFLARVTGSDPSLIYGLLKSNGTVALINQNGILVGPTGVVDVARFIASTLSISDSDFLAGRLNFSNGSLAGNVDNQGTIKTLSGGSVYLIGANVSNSGVITSPNGEILLAAGQTVQLIDTGTPGVTVNVTGISGKVTNLGDITAEAGRIGVAAGLISNSGNINASSVVNDGGRIFLRASQNLTTTATSKITANSVSKGGSVVLYSDKVAYLDGDISVTGADGEGGYVETSGKQSLDVVKRPSIGSGGTWLIDPYDLTVVSDSFTDNNITGGNVVSSIGGMSVIRASEINAMLDGNQGVALQTSTNTGGADAGNITVNAAITKSTAGTATLSLNADNNIYINANIGSSNVSGALNLNLNTNYEGSGSGAHSVVLNGATIGLNSGALIVLDNTASGDLSLVNGAKIDLNSTWTADLKSIGGKMSAGNLTLDATSSIAGAMDINTSVSLTGTLTNAGNVTLANAPLTAAELQNSGNVSLSNVTGTIGGALNNTGTFNVTNSSISATNGITNAGTFNVNYNTAFSGGALVNNGQMSFDSTANKPNGYTGLTAISLGNGMTNTGTVNVIGQLNNTGTMQNSGTINVGVGTAAATVSGGSWGNTGNLSIASGSAVTGNDFANTGNVTLTNGAMSFTTLANNVGGNLSGTGTITVGGGTGTLINSGTVAPGGDGTVGTLTVNGGYQQTSTGTLKIDISSIGHDVLALAAQSPLVLGGTLQTKLLGGYAPATDMAPISIITGAAQSDDTGVFRHVIGDVLTNGTLRMIKPTYGKGIQGLSVSMSGSEDLTYYGGGWGNVSAWAAHYFPTAIDNVIVSEAATLSHIFSDGIDTVNSIALSSGAVLAISGGAVNVGNITSSGTSSVTVSGEGGYSGFVSTDVSGPPTFGLLNISGSARVSSLTLSGSGAITGGSGSALSVTDAFSQSAGSVINSTGTVSLSQASGDLTVGNITASNLVLQAQNGGIRQASSGETETTVLHVTQQLLTSSATGTRLDSTNNRIAAFAGNNRGMGDIVLVNKLEVADTSAVKINGVTNANGSISITNTGAAATTALGSNANFLTTLPTDPGLESVPTLADRLTTLGIVTNGTVSAAGTGHSVTMATHSPLTIGSGGVTSSGAITLSAGAPDNLVINGVITSNGGGAISLSAGGSIFVNANIFTQGFYNGGTPTPTYAPGVSVTDSNGTTIPVAQVVQQIINPIIAQNIAPASNSVVTSVTTTQTVNNPVVPPTVPVSTPNPVTSSTTMTTGGETGSFGGEESGGTQSSSANSGVPKASPKMYCN